MRSEAFPEPLNRLLMYSDHISSAIISGLIVEGTHVKDKREFSSSNKRQQQKETKKATTKELNFLVSHNKRMLQTPI